MSSSVRFKWLSGTTILFFLIIKQAQVIDPKCVYEALDSQAVVFLCASISDD